MGFLGWIDRINIYCYNVIGSLENQLVFWGGKTEKAEGPQTPKSDAILRFPGGATATVWRLVMSTRLKVYLYNLSYAILFGLLVVAAGFAATRKGMWFIAFSIFACFDIAFQLFLMKTAFMREAKLAQRWMRVMGRTYEEYPRTPEEKDMLLGWTADLLAKQAISTSNGFRERDAQSAAFQNTKNSGLGSYVRTKTPEDLPKLRKAWREAIASAELQYLRSESVAGVLHRSYLELWDLFRDMKMLPVDQTTGRVYTDPDKFRKSSTDGRAPSDGVEGLTPETAS
jgi:hypothetical protein